METVKGVVGLEAGPRALVRRVECTAGLLTQDGEGSHKLHAVFIELEVDRPGVQDGAHQAPFGRAEPWG